MKIEKAHKIWNGTFTFTCIDSIIAAGNTIIDDQQLEIRKLENDLDAAIRQIGADARRRGQILHERDEARADAINYAEEYRDANDGKQTHNAERSYDAAVATLKKYGVKS